MTKQDYQTKSPLVIFLNYFKNHKKLFAIDVAAPWASPPLTWHFPW